MLVRTSKVHVCWCSPKVCWPFIVLEKMSARNYRGDSYHIYGSEARNGYGWSLFRSCLTVKVAPRLRILQVIGLGIFVLQNDEW